MKNKLFLGIFVFIMGLFTINIGQAEAANQVKEFNYEDYYDEDDRHWLRLEFCLADEKIELEEIPSTSEYSFKRVFVFKNTKAGKLNTGYTFDRVIAKSLTATQGNLNKAGKYENQSDLYVTLYQVKTIDEQEVRQTIIPRDKKSNDAKTKKYTRVIIELAADVPAASENPSDDLSFVEGVKNHTLVIDPGHGGSDSGAVGNGIKEKDITLDVSMKMKSILENSGANVIMTRTTDVDVYGPYASNSEELQARCDYVNNNTDIFVCVHINSASNLNANGTETYYCAGSFRGRKLAEFIQDELISLGATADRGVRTANFYVLRHTTVPAVLLELGFISNSYDATLLKDNGFRTSLAKAICNGIADYYKSIK